MDKQRVIDRGIDFFFSLLVESGVRDRANVSGYRELTLRSLMSNPHFGDPVCLRGQMVGSG